MGRVTTKMLAAELGVSVCTINKALTGKPQVSAETRARVLAVAERRGYRLNRLAKTLRRAVLRVGVVYPDAWPSHYMKLVEGVRERTAELTDYRFESHFHVASGLNDGLEFMRAVREALQAEPDGLILCLGDYSEEQLASLWCMVADSRVPVAFLGSVPEEDAPILTCVRHDAKLCGSLAADLLVWAKPDTDGPMAVFAGRHDLPEHREKIAAFAARLGKAPVVVETFDDPAQARPAAERLFQDSPGIAGVYIATENAEGVLDYLRGAGLSGKIPVVATGNSQVVRTACLDGLVGAAIQQRQHEQGRLAVSEMYRYLDSGIRPAPETLVRPEIFVRSDFESVL